MNKCFYFASSVKVAGSAGYRQLKCFCRKYENPHNANGRKFACSNILKPDVESSSTARITSEHLFNAMIIGTIRSTAESKNGSCTGPPLAVTHSARRNLIFVAANVFDSNEKDNVVLIASAKEKHVSLWKPEHATNDINAVNQEDTVRSHTLISPNYTMAMNLIQKCCFLIIVSNVSSIICRPMGNPVNLVFPNAGYLETAASLASTAAGTGLISALVSSNVASGMSTLASSAYYSIVG